MDMSLWVMYVLVGLFVLGCDTSQDEMTVLNKAQILEQIDEKPLLAKELCGKIAAAGEREFCIQYALQVMPKDEIATLRELCSTLEGNVKGECWFQVAETTLKVEDCERAEPFAMECYVHLTMTELQQSNANTWEQVEEIGNKYRFNFTDPIYGTMIYRYWFRNISCLHLEDCRTMKEPKICHDAMAQLYFRRLKEWHTDSNARCDSIPEKLAHNGQLLFQSAFENVYKEKM